MHVCVRVFVCVCVHACVCMCMRAGIHVTVIKITVFITCDRGVPISANWGN